MTPLFCLVYFNHVSRIALRARLFCGAEVMSIKMSTDSLAGSQIFSLFIKNSNCTERHPSQLWGLAVGRGVVGIFSDVLVVGIFSPKVVGVVSDVRFSFDLISAVVGCEINLCRCRFDEFLNRNSFVCNPCRSSEVSLITVSNVSCSLIVVR